MSQALESLPLTNNNIAIQDLDYEAEFQKLVPRLAPLEGPVKPEPVQDALSVYTRPKITAEFDLGAASTACFIAIQNEESLKRRRDRALLFNGLVLSAAGLSYASENFIG